MRITFLIFFFIKLSSCHLIEVTDTRVRPSPSAESAKKNNIHKGVFHVNYNDSIFAKNNIWIENKHSYNALGKVYVENGYYVHIPVIKKLNKDEMHSFYCVCLQNGSKWKLKPNFYDTPEYKYVLSLDEYVSTILCYFEGRLNDTLYLEKERGVPPQEPDDQ